MRLVPLLGLLGVLLLFLSASSSTARALAKPQHNNDHSKEATTTHEVACGSDVVLDSVEGGKLVDALNDIQRFPSHCHGSLYCHNCSLSSVSARLESVTLIHGAVQFLSPKAAVSFFHARWFNISTIKDLVISTQAKTARFEFSTIDYIEKLTAMCDTDFSNSEIRNIGQYSVTSYSSFSIVNSSLTRIESDGITAFSSAGVLLRNVFIEDLQHRAVVVTSEGDLVLDNVTLGSCSIPCFQVASRENIKLSGHVFVNGTKLDDDDILQLVSVRRGGSCEQRDSCDDNLCRQITTQKTGRIHRNFTKDANADELVDVFIDCGFNTTLMSQRGSVIRSSILHQQTTLLSTNRNFRSTFGRHSQGKTKNGQCAENAFLNITNSTFRTIDLSRSVSLSLENSCIEEVRDPLDFLKISNSKIGVLRDVVLDGMEVKWKNVSFGIIKDSFFGAENFVVVNSSVTEQILNLTIEGSFLIQKSFFHAISSLRVLAGGHLAFQNSSVNFLGPDSILLERGALISFSNVSISVWSEEAVGLVSYDQVLGYDYSNSGVWLPSLATLKLTPSTSLVPQTLRSMESSLLDRRFCVVQDTSAFCDFSAAPMTDILHTDSGRRFEQSMPRSSTYSNASSISLKRFGYSREMAIENTGLVHFPEFFELPGSLLVSNSSFSWLHTSASSLVLRKASAGALKMSNARKISSINSSVMTIAADVNAANFTDTFVERITKLKINKHTTFTNCKIQAIGRLAVFVSSNATLEIRNSTIDIIEKEGIIAEGNVFFDRVHVTSLSSFGMLLDKRSQGRHILHKVTFGQIAENGIFNLTGVSYSKENNDSFEMNEHDAFGEFDYTLSSFLSASKNSLYQFISYLPEVLRTVRGITFSSNRTSNEAFSSPPSKTLDDEEVNLTITFADSALQSKSNSKPVVISVPEETIDPDDFTMDTFHRILPYHKFSVKIGMDTIMSPYEICSHALHRNHSVSDSSLEKYRIDLWAEFGRCTSNPLEYAVAHLDHITRGSAVLVLFGIHQLWVQVLIGSLLSAILIVVLVVGTCCLVRRIAFERALRDLKAEKEHAAGDQLSRGNYFLRAGSRIGGRNNGSTDALFLVTAPHNMAYESSLAVFPVTSPIFSQNPSPESADHSSLNSSLSLTESTSELCIRNGNDPTQSMQCLADSQTCINETTLCSEPEDYCNQMENQDCDSSPVSTTSNLESRQSSSSVARGVLAKKLLKHYNSTSSSNSIPGTRNCSRSPSDGSERNSEKSSSSTGSKKVTLPVPLCNGPDDFEMEIFF